MKKNGKAPKIDKSDLDQKTRVLLENMSSDIKWIAEAQSSTGAQIAEIRANMATKSEVNTISTAVMSISGDVKNLQGDVKNLQGDVKNLQGDVKNLQGDVKNLQGDVKKLDGKVDAINARLKVVENKVDENLANHDNRITKLEEKVLV